MSNGSSHEAWSKESSDPERGGQDIKGKAICGQTGEWWFGECPQDIWWGLSAKSTLRTERQTLSKRTIWCTENRVCVGTSGSLR